MTCPLNDRQPWTWFWLLIWLIFCGIGTNYLIALFS